MPATLLVEEFLYTFLNHEDAVDDVYALCSMNIQHVLELQKIE